MKTVEKLLADVRWNAQGLVPVIAQDATDGTVLMMAWMDSQALAETIETGNAVYWSRSKKRLWRKGEESGNYQKVREIRLDCDGDTLLMLVDQIGGIACHTGRQSCFYRKATDKEWECIAPVLKAPSQMYANPKGE